MKRIKLILSVLVLFLCAGVNIANSREIKVLAIGNSFSEDSIEQYLWEIGQSEGVEFIIGNMYIGGCSLEKHYTNMTENAPAYAYRKIAGDGIKRETPNMTLGEALADEDWDYVTLQQASGYSGLYDSYVPYLPALVAFVRAHVKPDCKLGWHMTWAYQGDSNHKHFPFYDNSQEKMYNAILSCTTQLLKDNDFDFLIPSGTAVQNARTSSIGDTMTRDGYHMNRLYGRYTLSCTWFEILSGRPVSRKAYYPQDVSPEQARIARKSAHAAVKSPMKVRKIR